MKLLLKYSLVLCVVFAFVYAKGQTENPKQEYFNSTIAERKFDEQKWEELTKDFDYSEQLFEDYDEEFDSLQTNPNANKKSSQSGGSRLNSAFWASLFQVIFIIIVVAVIVVLLVNMLGAGNLFAPRSRKISKSAKFSIEEIENNIHETDLDKFIREAVEGKKYALAIRLYYLAIIKELSRSKLIKWKRNKTNRSYLSEIRTTNLFNSFREVTRIFERVWYGEGNLDEQKYLSIKPKFEHLKKAVHAKASTLEND
jgi:Domain of unknown function (DUF4129)